MVRVKQIAELSSMNVAASTQGVFTAPCPLEIVGIKIVTLGAGDANTAANVRINRRTIAGNTSSGVTNAYAGTFTIPGSVAEGTVLYDSGFEALQELKLEAGDQLAFEPINVSTNAYSVIPFVEFVVIDDSPANFATGV